MDKWYSPSESSGSSTVTIKDIARLAGVSIATVSKVLNNKDQDISEETRTKINKVISDNNYIPYRKVVKRMGAKSDTIGLVISSGGVAGKEWIRGAEAAAYQEEMSLIVCHTEGLASKEKRYFKMLRDRHAEGIVFVPSSDMGHSHETLIAQDDEDWPIVVVDHQQGGPDMQHLALDFEQGMHMAVQCLAEHGHERIGYIGGHLDDASEHAKFEGYKKALYENHINFDKSLIFEGASGGESSVGYEGAKQLLSMGATAIATSSDVIACGVYAAAAEQAIRIPEALSIIGFGDSDICKLVIPTLSSVQFPFYEGGFAAVMALLDQIRNREKGKKQVFQPSTIVRGSVAAPRLIDLTPKEKIAIVGSLNMDIIMRVPHIPKVGETILAQEVKNAAGGKGANQAVGAGKLGGKVYMIGRVGNDLHGRELYNSLIKNGVDASGVIFDELLPTGNAYIHVSDKGENNIVVNPGANSRLSREQVQSVEWIFDEVSYCLVQMEIPADTIRYVARICKRKNVKLIIKPAPAHNFNFDNFEEGFLIVPNETDLALMLPGGQTVEEKAYQLLNMNYQNVIVTMGAKGCLLVNADTKQYFDAADFQAVDTTAASDSFISGVTVALAEGKDLIEAIRYGSLAAGITVSREGAQPSLPDQDTMRIYM
ncbi:PfkB family carbohydrate kinase [Paenibacillus sp.]|jgi:ribokinase|uniref:PfkB family carbohydrate kinase n=1 Tax=Paenibacillus sp. TaxID=58172 RepID=UPI002835B8F7|nr:PfkB family carbohydrate kinase [Paenibacillus sp.]MDR0267164.1 PfkB family carbohydrate kinase [Paenibacillus sp.]